MSAFKHVTLRDVAAQAGVSYALVSKVLNGSTNGNIRVGKEKKERILRVANEMGYVPNHLARNLKEQNNNLISIFTYEEIGIKEVMDEYYDFIRGIHEEGEIEGFDILLLNSRKNIASSSRITMSAGSIMIGVLRDNQDILALMKRNFPIVFSGRREIEGKECQWVGLDYRSAIKKLIAALAAQHLDNILYITAGKTTEPYRDKEDFVKEFAAQYHLKVSTLVHNAPDALTSEDKQLLFDNDVYITDRVWHVHWIEQYIEDNHFVLGKDKKGILLEDDWTGTHGKWTRWDNERKELGRLSLQLLSTILKEKPRPQNNLVSLTLISSVSFPLDVV